MEKKTASAPAPQTQDILYKENGSEQVICSLKESVVEPSLACLQVKLETIELWFYSDLSSFLFKDGIATHKEYIRWEQEARFIIYHWLRSMILCDQRSIAYTTAGIPTVMKSEG